MSDSRWGETVNEQTMGQSKCNNRRNSQQKLLRLDSTGEVTSESGLLSKSIFSCPGKISHRHNKTVDSDSCFKKIATNLGVGTIFDSANSYIESAAKYLGNKQVPTTKLTRDNSNSLAYFTTVISSSSGRPIDSASETDLETMCLKNVNCKCGIVETSNMSANTCSTWSYRNLFPKRTFKCLASYPAMKMPITEKYIPPQMRSGIQARVGGGVPIDPKLTPYNARLLEKSKKNQEHTQKIKPPEVHTPVKAIVEPIYHQAESNTTEKTNPSLIGTKSCDIDIKTTDITQQSSKDNPESEAKVDENKKLDDELLDWFEYECPDTCVPIEIDTDLLNLSKKCQTEGESIISSPDSEIKRLHNWYSIENDTEVNSDQKEKYKTGNCYSSPVENTSECFECVKASSEEVAKLDKDLKEEVKEHENSNDYMTEQKQPENSSAEVQCDSEKQTESVSDISAILFVRNYGKKRRRSQKRKREKAQVQEKLNTSLKPGSAVHPRSPVSFVFDVDSGSPSNENSFSFQIICDTNSDSDVDWSDSEDGSEEDFSSLDDDEILGLRCNDPLSSGSCGIWAVSCSDEPTADTVQTSSNSVSSELEAINKAWELNISMQPESKPVNGQSHKKVHFADDTSLVDVHDIIDDDCAYAEARKGPWEQYARDRERFSRRIAEVSSVVNPVLLSAHRDRIHRERFNE